MYRGGFLSEEGFSISIGAPAVFDIARRSGNCLGIFLAKVF
jgi:hypothetical protein